MTPLGIFRAKTNEVFAAQLRQTRQKPSPSFVKMRPPIRAVKPFDEVCFRLFRPELSDAKGITKDARAVNNDGTLRLPPALRSLSLNALRFAHKPLPRPRGLLGQQVIDHIAPTEEAVNRCPQNRVI